MQIRERVPEVPPDRRQDHLARIMASFERIRRGDRHGSLPYQSLGRTSQRNLVPVFAHSAHMNAPAYKRFEPVVLGGLFETEDAVIGQVPNPGCKAKTE